MPELVVNTLLFVFGAAIGSFINVLGFRYSVKKGFKDAFVGRSMCPQCKTKLKWIDLIPIFSFVFLMGKCRTCKKPISWRYPLGETIAALIALFVPLQIGFGIPALLWVLCLWILLLISIVDFRLKIIPDSLVVLIAVLGLGLMALKYFNGYFDGLVQSDGISFMGTHYITFRIGVSALLNHVYSILFALGLFGGLYAFSKGRAMGMGDVKLASALGLWLIFPDMVLSMALAFIVGSIIGLAMMQFKKLKFKSNVPFGPFIAAGVTLVFFFGYDIVNAYFKIFGIF